MKPRNDMTHDEYYDLIKDEWCMDESQYERFYNDLMVFAVKYKNECEEDERAIKAFEGDSFKIRCTNCGVDEIITNDYCNCCGSKQIQKHETKRQS